MQFQKFMQIAVDFELRLQDNEREMYKNFIGNVSSERLKNVRGRMARL